MHHTWDTLGTISLALWQPFCANVRGRNYVTQDVLRRILSDYFGYDIHFVMNITDIDDKVRLTHSHAVLLL